MRSNNYISLLNEFLKNPISRSWEPYGSIARQMILLSFLGALTCSQAQAATMNKQELTEYNTDLRKVSSHLLIARKQLKDGIGFTDVVGGNQLLKSKGDQLKIEVKLNELTADIVQQIRDAGMDIEQSHFEYAVVRVKCPHSLATGLLGFPHFT